MDDLLTTQANPKKLQKQIKRIIAIFIYCVNDLSNLRDLSVSHEYFCKHHPTPKSTQNIAFQRYFISITVDCG